MVYLLKHGVFFQYLRKLFACLYCRRCGLRSTWSLLGSFFWLTMHIKNISTINAIVYTILYKHIYIYLICTRITPFYFPLMFGFFKRAPLIMVFPIQNDSWRMERAPSIQPPRIQRDSTGSKSAKAVLRDYRCSTTWWRTSQLVSGI